MFFVGCAQVYKVSNESLDLLVSASSTQGVKTDGGWKSIEVFYGKIQEHPEDDEIKWFAQAKQDELVLSLFRNKCEGFFIDLAANDRLP
jgi:hypothetical protein